jgi:hypothetical protein
MMFGKAHFVRKRERGQEFYCIGKRVLHVILFGSNALSANCAGLNIIFLGGFSSLDISGIYWLFPSYSNTQDNDLKITCFGEQTFLIKQSLELQRGDLSPAKLPAFYHI